MNNAILHTTKEYSVIPYVKWIASATGGSDPTTITISSNNGGIEEGDMILFASGFYDDGSASIPGGVSAPASPYVSIGSDGENPTTELKNSSNELLGANSTTITAISFDSSGAANSSADDAYAGAYLRVFNGQIPTAEEYGSSPQIYSGRSINGTKALSVTADLVGSQDTGDDYVIALGIGTRIVEHKSKSSTWWVGRLDQASQYSIYDFEFSTANPVIKDPSIKTTKSNIKRVISSGNDNRKIIIGGIRKPPTTLNYDNATTAGTENLTGFTLSSSYCNAYFNENVIHDAIKNDNLFYVRLYGGNENQGTGGVVTGTSFTRAIPIFSFQASAGAAINATGVFLVDVGKIDADRILNINGAITATFSLAVRGNTQTIVFFTIK